jgi:AraC-like DNA-binding protein
MRSTEPPRPPPRLPRDAQLSYSGAMTFIFLLAALQAFFLASLLAAKKGKSTADRVLLVWLAGIGIHTAIYFLHVQYRAVAPFALNLNAGFPFLQGPLLLAYVAALIGMRDRFGSTDWLHLIPFVAFITYLSVAFGAGTFALERTGRATNVSIFALAPVFTTLLLLSVPVYIAWSLVIMRRAGQVLGTPDLPSGFLWIRACIAGLGLVWLAAIATFLFGGDGAGTHPHAVFWALTLFVYGLGYLGLTRTTIFREPQIETLKQNLQPKYRKSGLGPDEVAAMHRELIAFMDAEQSYLDGELSLQTLADQLGFSTNQLSQVINDGEGCSFRDYVNARRVREACRRLDSDPGTPLLTLAMDCGFNSKSSFNRAFRKFTGKTPSAYAKSS